MRNSQFRLFGKSFKIDLINEYFPAIICQVSDIDQTDLVTFVCINTIYQL